MDETVPLMQGTSDQASIVGFDLVPVRVGVGGARRQSREHYRVHRTNVNIPDKEVSLRVRAAYRLERAATARPAT